MLEIATFTLQGALDAYHAGAHRLELCENPNDGGTTPSYGMLKKVKELIPIPVFPIIRPRGGNFAYSSDEIEVIMADILLCKELGYEGVVIGFLDEKGNVNKESTKAAVALAFPMEVTFHRAFDRANNPEQALEDCIACGCKRILTSGQFPSLMNGLNTLKLLVEKAQDKIIIMPGSGLKSDNIKEVMDLIGAKEYHTAARKKIYNEDVFSPTTMNEQMNYIGIDPTEIKHILSIINEYAS